MPILSPRAIYLLTQLNLFALCVALCGGFYMQFVHGELPCPLCYSQRLVMMLCGLGLASLLLQVRRHGMTAASAARAYGFVILAALLGGSISVRQILLHIVPPDPGFGSAVMGLHLYTWGLLVFFAEVFSAGALLLCMKLGDAPTQPLPFGTLQRALLILFAAVIALNMLAVFAAAGWHWHLPSDPVQYLLFK
jgi:disulfide bond formation protein DsbB